MVKRGGRLMSPYFPARAFLTLSSGAQLLLDVLEFLDVLLEVAARKLGDVDVFAVKSGWNNT